MPAQKLKQVNRIKRLLSLPFVFLMVIAIITALLQFAASDGYPSVNHYLYVSFYIVIILFVVIAYGSSYFFLKNKTHKNLIIFILIQLIALFIMYAYKLQIPIYGKDVAAGLTVLISIAIPGIIYLAQMKVKIPVIKEENYAEDIETNDDSYLTLGVIFSALFSLLIAGILYFHTKEGIQFVAWGTVFGILISRLILSDDKSILGLFSLIDPTSASSLFELNKIEEQVSKYRDKVAVYDEKENKLQEKNILKKKIKKSKVQKKAYELEDKLDDIKIEYVDDVIKTMLQKLDSSKDLDPSERAMLADRITKLIRQLENNEIDYIYLDDTQHLLNSGTTNFSIEEKIKENYGLNDNETHDAITKNLIDKSQMYIWSKKSQLRLHRAIRELDKGEFQGGGPMYVVNSVTNYIADNQQVLDALSDAVISINHESLDKLISVQGSGKRNLKELRFKTIIGTEYGAIIKVGTKESAWVLGVFETDD